MASKLCTACYLLKPLTDFLRAATCVDGHRSYCKACSNARRKLQRSLCAKQREAHNTRGTQWAVLNTEKRKATQAAYNAKYRASGRAKLIKKQLRAEKPAQYRAYTSARRKRVQQATPPWVCMEEIRSFYCEAVRQQLTVDHIVPLRGALVSGLHVPWNLQLLSAADNARKRNSFDVEWLDKGGKTAPGNLKVEDRKTNRDWRKGRKGYDVGIDK